jgi:hypothetical protein
MRPPLDRSPLRTALALAAVCLAVYNVNLRQVSSQDTIPARILPVAIVLDRTLTLDRFFRDHRDGQPLPYWVQRAGPHYVSSYPLTPPLLAVPVYAGPIALFGGDSWALLNLLAKLSASLIASLSVALVYLALTRLTARPAALALAAVYAFATSTWSVSSQGLWGHGAVELFMALAIWSAARGDRHPGAFAVAGVSLGLMVATRPITAPIAAALLAYLLSRRWRAGAVAGGLFALAVLPFAAYNLTTFGTWDGGYARMHADFAADGFQGTWDTPLAAGLAGLLFSPSRGLLVYSPILAVALWGVVHALARRSDPVLYRYLAAGVVAMLLILGHYSVWFGGASFGPRLLTDCLPALVVCAAAVWTRLEASRLLRAGTLALAVWSVAVQAIGAFYFPSDRAADWNTAPREVPITRRLWDWKDPQLLRLLENGPHPVGFAHIE